MTMSIKNCIQHSQWTPLLQGSERIYFAPHIPWKKLQGALTYLPRGMSPDDILILQDDTVFGSAKDGFCVTCKGLFHKASFENVVHYLFEHIHHIEVKQGILNRALVINHVSEFSLTQIGNGEVRALAGLLEDICQSQSTVEAHRTQQEAYPKQDIAIDEARIVLDLFSYYITYPSGQWDDQSRTAMAQYFTDMGMPNEQLDSALTDLFQQAVKTDYEALLTKVSQQLTQQPYGTRMNVIHNCVHVMAFGRVSQNQAEQFMTELCRASNVSRAVIPDTVPLAYSKIRGQSQQHKVIMNHEQYAACSLLALQPGTLNEQSLQQAYRQKMAEFHPDKYQNLPESVRQLIEQQAQQLNQARDILKAYLGC